MASTTKKTGKFNNFLVSCRKMGPYIALQTKLSFNINKNRKLSSKILNIVGLVVIYALFLTLSYFFIKALVSQTTLITGPQVGILFFSIAEIILLIVSISLQYKRLYKPNDWNIIATIPFSTIEKYFAEILFIFLRLTILSLILFYPFLIIYGAAGGFITNVASQTAIFIFSSLFSAILLPWIPFAISLIISVPFIFLGSWLQNKNIVKLVLFILGFILLLVAYSLILHFLSDWWIHASTSVDVMQGIANFLSALNKPYNLAFFASQICLAKNMGINFLCLLGIGIVGLVIGILITKTLYSKFVLTMNSNESVAVYKNKNSDYSSPYKAIFAKEIKEIIRTQSYAFFYLGVAFSMPILTFLITDLIRDLGQAETGNHIFFGFSLLVLLIIVSLIGSYSANVVSKEGKQIYITKCIPVSYRKQLLIKLLVNFTISFIGLFLCIVVLGATATTVDGANYTLSIADLFILFFITTLFLIGITFNGVNIELVRPKFNTLGKQNNESNIVIQLVIGLVITAILSLATIIIDGIAQQYTLYVHLSVLFIMLIYALVNFLVFFLTANKKYSRIECK